MNVHQQISMVAPLLVLVTMYPIFRCLSRSLGRTLGWYFGLMVYWLLWGLIFPWLLLGKDALIQLIQPQKLNWSILLLMLFPILMASLYRFVPNMGYEKPNFWYFALYLSTAFGNGIFEEVFWRGVYLTQFPEQILLSVIWPSIFFTLWHYIPGSTHTKHNVLGLMVGSALFGLYLGFLANHTNTIFWPIITHVIAGIVMVF